ncbi:cyclic nucleotide-binding domain-containing protein [Ferrovibrio sp.]|uniref:cyclic nucleotide-binding domain-containing protein n=1 Tax=Ferrovibrio sp. TaxID=1917215 RepID=UPI0025B80CCC|nr:cyclic nucleotide-binding domain-containing protein [Ferrovibrio sp.]MBX3456053.1 cyclic nucleotide-binding domain-containing protein [Ferrovibrio sp.]
MSTQKQPFKRRIYLPGQTIFKQGDRGDCMFFIEKGTVRLTRSDASGDFEIGKVLAGGIFGEMALIDDKPRSASAMAVDESVLHEVPGDMLKQKLATADPFLRKLVQILSSNLRQSLVPPKPPENS